MTLRPYVGWPLFTGLVLALTVCSTPAAGQTTPSQPGQPPRTPPRDSPTAQKTGTAAVRGRVVAADTGRPLRRARITLAGEGQGPDGRRTTSTNLDGRYEFKELPAGRYRLSVVRGGYLPLDYGQRRPGEIGRPVELSNAETLEKLDFALPRMGVIAGRVTDENGEPIEGVTVYAMRSMFFEGRRRLVPVSQRTETDDAGEYRIARIAPGTYSVMATTKETWTVTQAGKETMYGYLPTYFPGVAQANDARSVRVGIGQEVSGTDISLMPGRAARVSGIAVDSQGRPFPRVSLSDEVRGVNFASFMGGPSAPVAADGTFSILNVAPGTYTLQASRMDTDPEVALTQVTIDGTDIENIMLTGSAGGTVSGRVVSETGTLPKTGVSVFVTEALRNQPSPAVLGAFRNSRTPEIKEDGAFTAMNVFGRARFRVTVPDGWMVKSIMHAGRDITEDVLELRSGESLSGVEILLTDRVTSLGGQVLDARDAPLGDATVLVFPSTREKWYETSRAVRAARPDQQGKWQLKGLPADDYLVLALEYVEDGAWNDPDYLESLREQAQKVTLADGGTGPLTLKLLPTK